MTNLSRATSTKFCNPNPGTARKHNPPLLKLKKNPNLPIPSYISTMIVTYRLGNFTISSAILVTSPPSSRKGIISLSNLDQWNSPLFAFPTSTITTSWIIISNYKFLQKILFLSPKKKSGVSASSSMNLSTGTPHPT